MKTRTYSELSRIETFEERYNYLKLIGEVGKDTFGFDRFLNQNLYSSKEWKRARRDVIIRDNGCDLGIEGKDIFDHIIVHHMNPITVQDILNGEKWIYDPEYLICVSHQTHNAIHYGDASQLSKPLVKREKGDTKLW